ncbi:MAG TPA: chaperone modulator CbpM [Aquaticitalea sp.]|nr:chaperone modulator CbpM [Aquaticitalea sp.]
MSSKNLIPIQTLCKHYKVETSFFTGLSEHGLIEVTTIAESNCIHQDHIQQVEKMIRLHQDLHLNVEGIDTVLNLLQRIEQLQSELQSAKRRLGIYEG